MNVLYIRPSLERLLELRQSMLKEGFCDCPYGSFARDTHRINTLANFSSLSLDVNSSKSSFMVRYTFEPEASTYFSQAVDTR